MVSQKRVGWLRNIASLTGARVVGYLLPLITFPVVVRALGPELYGRWVFAQSIISFLGLLANPGLKAHGLQQVASPTNEHRDLVSIIITLLTVSGGIALTLALVLAPVLTQEPTTRWMIVILGISLFIASPLGLDWLFSGLQQFHRTAALQLTAQLVFTVGVFLFLRGSATVWILPVFSLLGTVITAAISLVWIRKLGIRLRPVYNREVWYGTGRVAVYYAAASIFSLVMQRSDHLIIAWMKGDAALGQYGAAYRLVDALLGFALMGTTLMVPYAASLSATPDKLQGVMRRGFFVLLVISLPLAVGGVMLGKDLLLWVLGPTYADAALPFRILILAVPLGGLSGLVTGSALYAQGLHRRYTITVASGAIINMVLNLLLISKWGGVGAAIATVVAQGAIGAVGSWMGRHRLVGVFGRCQWPPVIASASMAAILALLSLFPLHVGVRITAGALAYGAALLVLGKSMGGELYNMLQSARLHGNTARE